VRTKISLDLDRLLKILENPIRRRIIERLSQEPSYSLRISKELGLGQQLVTKHLNLMEDSGLVKAETRSSPSGPKRRVFNLTKSFSMIIDVGPHLFKQNILAFEIEPEQHQISPTTFTLIKKRDSIIDYPNEKDKMIPFSKVLTEIDKKLDALERERTVLLSLRNSIKFEGSKIIQEIGDSDSRRVFHSAFDEQDKSIKRISQTLNLREDKVTTIIRKLKNELKTEFFQWSTIDFEV
jgi:predicted transcriptional regulator